MKHRILVLGAGYAGAFAAGSLARRLSPADTQITVVNAEPVFVERIRMHQLAAGRELATRRLADASRRRGAGGVRHPGAAPGPARASSRCARIPAPDVSVGSCAAP